MRVAMVALVVLLSLGGASSQTPPTPAVITVGDLTITGDVKTVLVVNKFPITVTAPQDGGALHWWQFPDGVMGVDKGDSLEITSAPLGEVAVTVRYAVAVIDWEKKSFKLVNKTLSSTFMNGVAPPGPADPMDGVTVPPDLQASLAAAYAAETDPQKAARLPLYVAALKFGVPGIRAKGIAATRGQFDKVMSDFISNSLGGKIEQGVLPATRKALGTWTNSQLPREDASLTEDYWTKLNTVALQGAKALSALIKGAN